VLATCPSTSSEGLTPYDETPVKIPKKKKKEIPDGFVDASHKSTKHLITEEENMVIKRKRKKKKLLINLHYT